MKVHTITGALRDHILLTAETVAECADLVDVARSEFIPGGVVEIGIEPWGLAGSTICLRIYFPRPIIQPVAYQFATFSEWFNQWDSTNNLETRRICEAAWTAARVAPR